jgi:dephospho-CoA kinase
MMKRILAFVGMPGAGKTEATKYLEEKGIPFIRFGSFTDKAVREAGLPLNTQNERLMREKLRSEMGMEAYAILAKPEIDELFKKSDLIAIDGLYSWEEYTYLKKYYPELTLIDVFAEPKIRYERLLKRPIRPVPLEEAYGRDVNELEKLNKGGPIAIADYLIVNNGGDINELYSQIDKLLKRLNLQ